MTTLRAPDRANLRRAVEDVADPELPVLTLGMLGMVYDLHLESDGDVLVELLPTFAGCPATEMIERDVVAALSEVAGVTRVRVRFRYDPPWSAQRISETGRAALQEFGIAPPGGTVTGTPEPEGRTTLPLAPAPPPVRTCPFCGSRDTVQDAAFGPTPCRNLQWCHDCCQPFEAFKEL